MESEACLVGFVDEHGMVRMHRPWKWMIQRFRRRERRRREREKESNSVRDNGDGETRG